jgi:DivIVA domain-containing protein
VPRRRSAGEWPDAGAAGCVAIRQVTIEHGTIDAVITVIEYIVIAAVIGAVAFGIAAVAFGRGEQMAPLPARTSPAELPADGLRGDHVRRVRFGLALRGYRMSDVDWALDRLADEIDQLNGTIERLTAPSGAGPVADAPSAGRTAE